MGETVRETVGGMSYDPSVTDVVQVSGDAAPDPRRRMERQREAERRQAEHDEVAEVEAQGRDSDSAAVGPSPSLSRLSLKEGQTLTLNLNLPRANSPVRRPRLPPLPPSHLSRTPTAPHCL